MRCGSTWHEYIGGLVKQNVQMYNEDQKMVKEKEIRSYFDKRQAERMSWATRTDAVGYSYQDYCIWFFKQLRDIRGQALDVGCNVGNLPFLCRKYGLSADHVHFTGIDIAEESIRIAKSRGIPGATFRVGSALSIDFPDNAFDAVACMEVIEHIPDQPKAMHEMARVLKPGGILVLSTPNADCRPWLLDERVRFFAWRLLGRKLVEKDNPLSMPALKQILLESNLLPVNGPHYYWYRPYHIFKGYLYWPIHFVAKGLLGAMKHCKGTEESGRLSQEQQRYYCQSLLVTASKGKINNE